MPTFGVNYFQNTFSKNIYLVTPKATELRESCFRAGEGRQA